MQKMITLLLAAAVALGACLGCTTTRTLPDGTVEVESLDPAALQAFVVLATAALEAAQATRDSGGIDQPPRDLLEDIVTLQEIARATQLIAQDGVTAEELVELQELYRQASVILERNGVRLKLKMDK